MQTFSKLSIPIALLYLSQPVFAEEFRVGAPTSGVYTETCTATVFCTRGDKWCGGKSPYLKRKVRPSDQGIAHRTLPVGTRVRITNPRTKLSTLATVVDRGPFGRVNRHGKWYSGAAFYRRFLHAKRAIPATMASHRVDGWRGCVDMTARVGRAIKFSGKEVVLLEVVRWPKQKRRKPST